MLQVDRLFIGSIISVAAVTFFFARVPGSITSADSKGICSLQAENTVSRQIAAILLSVICRIGFSFDILTMNRRFIPHRRGHNARSG